jgi:Tfp pilus assembly protein PilF
MPLSNAAISFVAAFLLSSAAQNRVDPNAANAINNNTGVIEGHVVLPSGHPINSSVSVTLSNANVSGLTVFTDSDGTFSFQKLAEATYTLEVNADPKVYKPLTQSVRLIRNMHLNLRIELEEKDRGGHARGPATVSAGESAKNVPGPAQREYEQGARLASQGDTHGAIDHLKKAIELFPSFLEALNDLGVQYLKDGQLEDAAEQFSAAIEISGTSFNPRLNLGIVLVRQHRYQEGMDQLTRAASIDGGQAAPRLYLGLAALETDDLPMAERELSKCLALGQAEYSVAHYYLAQVHLKNGQREPAASELRAYLDAAPAGQYASQARALLNQLK